MSDQLVKGKPGGFATNHADTGQPEGNTQAKADHHCQPRAPAHEPPVRFGVFQNAAAAGDESNQDHGQNGDDIEEIHDGGCLHQEGAGAQLVHKIAVPVRVGPVFSRG